MSAAQLSKTTRRLKITGISTTSRYYQKIHLTIDRNWPIVGISEWKGYQRKEPVGQLEEYDQEWPARLWGQRGQKGIWWVWNWEKGQKRVKKSIFLIFSDPKLIDELKSDKKDDKKDGKIKDEKTEKQDLTFWVEKLFEYDIPHDDDANDGIRTTRKRYQAKYNDRSIRKIEFLDVEHIKNMLLSTEEGMTLYLNKWNARWGSPKVKDKLVKPFNLS
jgi:hypothetical protein